MKVAQDSEHLRWAAEKLQGQLDQQEDIQQRLEKKAISSIAWPLGAITAAVGVFPSALENQTWQYVTVGLALVTAVVGYVAIVVKSGAAMNVLNYYDDNDLKWESYDTATAARVTINALQSSIGKRRKELSIKGIWTRAAQTISLLTLLVLALAVWSSHGV